MMKILDNGLKALLALLLAAMVGAVLWQIISRYFLSEPSGWTEELARMLLIWIGILGGSYAYRTSSHLGLDLLKEKLNAKNQIKLGHIIDLCVFAFAAVVMIYGGFLLVVMTFELSQTTAVLGIPMAYVYLVIPMSGGLIALYAVLSMVARQEEASLNLKGEDA